MTGDPYFLLLLLCAAAQGLVARILTRGGSLARRRVLAAMEAPGLYAHELSHALIALVFGGAPTRLSIWPRGEGATYRGLPLSRGVQGFVLHTTAAPFSALVDAAPLLLLPLAAHLPEYIPLPARAWLGALLLRYGLPSLPDVRRLAPYSIALLVGYVGLRLISH